jgi:hypothetical protein
MKFDTFGNTTKEPFIAEGFTEPSIFLNSDRIVLFAAGEEQGDIAIFANNNVHIKGKSVQIRNAEVVDVNSKQFVQNVENVYRITQDVKAGNVIILPEGIVEEGADKAQEYRKNINKLIVKINSLIPAAIPGTRATPNPLWFKNIRDGIKEAREALEQNKLITSLKWLDFKKWKTYTIEELKEAWSPVPGMAEIISKLGNLQSLIEDVERVQEEYNVIKSDIENTRAILSAPKDYIAEIAYGSAVTFGGKEIVSLTDILNKYEDDGGKLNEVENGEELKERLQSVNQEIEQGVFDEADEERIFGDGDPNSSTTANSLVGKLKSDIQSGLYNGFMMQDLDLEIKLETETAKKDLTVMLSEASKQNQEIQEELK